MTGSKSMHCKKGGWRAPMCRAGAQAGAAQASGRWRRGAGCRGAAGGGRGARRGEQRRDDWRGGRPGRAARLAARGLAPSSHA
jgi:hypothetical protein